MQEQQPQYVRVQGESIPLGDIAHAILGSTSSPPFVNLFNWSGGFRSVEFTHAQEAQAFHTLITKSINSRHHINEPSLKQPAKDYYVDPSKLLETLPAKLNNQPTTRNLVRVGATATFPGDSIVSIRVEGDTVIVEQRVDGQTFRSNAEFDTYKEAQLAYNQALKDWSGSDEYGIKV